ncbi:PAS/histidine kinase/ATPase domain-containing protein [Xenorhabdus vietnamensis]|uniref:histidine kinase n=2 Tax=Xenorhabdus vietnamensis TaxID=351656 RepID=A0A1Y2SAL3_9GAMM|nr:PAS/histidine kinase/ATPase domain-containing protein [Xenorhabdus vietnamensis]
MFDISLQKRQGCLLMLASLPQSLLLLGLMYHEGVSGYLIGVVVFVLTLILSYCLVKVIQLQNYRIATITNLVESMVNNEFNIRSNATRHHDLIEEMLNRLSMTLGQQQREIKQQQVLIGKIINNVDIAIIAFDEQHNLSFINAGTEKLMKQPASQLVNQSVQSLNIAPFLHTTSGQIIEWRFPNKQGRFQIKTDHYFDDGQKKTLLFITDVSAILREEQTQAWGNLFRVMSHEINNTLTPISSLSQVLKQLLPKDKDQSLNEVHEGLCIIEERSKSLKSFIDSYRKLNQLPPPFKSRVLFRELLEGILPLFDHRTIILDGETDLTLTLDPVQTQQTVINILKNADEAMSDPQGQIYISWRQEQHQFSLDIADQGTGLMNKDNLFVPFYTTKPSGSGIGLTLCRKIAENHGGYFTLEDRIEQKGCVAKLMLPYE